MQVITQIIDQNKWFCEDLVEYKILINKAKSNVELHPDICIEACKSLVEGICKRISIDLDPSLNSEQDFRRIDFVPLVSGTVKLLKQHDPLIDIEEELLRRCIPIMDRIGVIRNRQGDVSHGRIYPKERYSDPYLAQFAMLNTEAISSYLLNLFFIIKKDDQSEIEYDNNEEFNDYLDEQYELEGKVKFSRALFDQDIDDYLYRFEEFKKDEHSQHITKTNQPTSDNFDIEEYWEEH